MKIISQNIVCTYIALHNSVYFWKFYRIYNPITYKGGDCITFVVLFINQYRIRDFSDCLIPDMEKTYITWFVTG